MLGPLTFPSKKYTIYDLKLNSKYSKILKQPKDTSKYVSYSKSSTGTNCNISAISCTKGVKNVNLATSNQKINIYSGTLYTVTVNNVAYKTTMYNSCLSIINSSFSLHILCLSETYITITSSASLTINSIKSHFVIQPTENKKVIEYTTAKNFIGEKLTTLPLPNLTDNFQILVNKKNLLILSNESSASKYFMTTDGTTWTEHSFPYTLKDITVFEYNNKYIIMSDATPNSSSSAIEYTLVTTDWKSWKKISNLTTAKINWGFSKYIVNGRLYFMGYDWDNSKYLIYTSTDGETYTSINIPNTDIDSPKIKYVNSLYIIESYYYDTCSCLYTSSNGTSFTKRSLPCSNEYHYTLYFNGYYVKTPYNNNTTDNKIMYSTDGATWKSANIPTTSTSVRYQEPTIFKNKLILHNYSSSSTSSKLYVFTTPTSYSTITLPSCSYGYRDPVQINDSFCLITKSSSNSSGSAGASSYVYSTDGTTWTEYSFPEAKQYSGNFTYNSELGIVYYISSSGYIYTSKDGKSWVKRTKVTPVFNKLYNGILAKIEETGEDTGYFIVTYSLDNFNSLSSFTIALSDYTSKSSVGSYPTYPEAQIAELNNRLFIFIDIGNNYIGKSKHYFEMLELSSKTFYKEVT